MTKDDWVLRFKNYLRPRVNDAPTKDDLETFLTEEAEAAYENVGDGTWDDGLTPEQAADECIYAITVLG